MSGIKGSRIRFIAYTAANRERKERIAIARDVDCRAWAVKGDIEGLAVASDERTEAYVLYMKDGAALAIRSLVRAGPPVHSVVGGGTCSGTGAILAELE